MTPHALVPGSAHTAHRGLAFYRMLDCAPTPPPGIGGGMGGLRFFTRKSRWRFRRLQQEEEKGPESIGICCLSKCDLEPVRTPWPRSDVFRGYSWLFVSPGATSRKGAIPLGPPRTMRSASSSARGNPPSVGCLPGALNTSWHAGIAPANCPGAIPKHSGNVHAPAPPGVR